MSGTSQDAPGAGAPVPLLAWGSAPARHPAAATIPALVAARAAAAPDAVALADDRGRHLSYGRLAAEAADLAHRLRRLGVGPEVPVALAAERSIEMVVAMLGILEAGGAYVPLDPGHPADRIGFILADVEPPVVVGRREALARLPPHRAREVELGPRGGAAAGGSAGLDPGRDPGLDPDGLMYVLYTSGSTGRPKGVAVSHANVLRLVLGADYLRLGPDEVFLLLAPAAFDASTLEIWAPLVHGARLVVHPPGPPSPRELGDLLARHRVTTLWLTAGFLHQMVDANLGGLAPVRQLLAGGDVLSPAHVRRLLDAHPGMLVVNGYGPTENTTFTCCGPLRSAGEVGASVPIGRPVPGTRVWVLGRGGEPAAVGEEGELLAGGAGVARGYFGRPGLTAERFVPDPLAALAGEPGARVYRTGDRVRWRPDGRLDFAGRIDDQVKIRGFRVEPGEVAAVLAEHPGVREAVVVATDGDAGARRLVAYAVAARPAPSPRELRSWLAARLPEPMVPAAFVLLDELPLTANGKVDRRALPEPPRTRPDLDAAYRPPEGPVEHALAAIFAELLGIDPVGADDSLFELGGHSLVATQVVTRLRERLGRDCPIAELFAHPTPAALAARLDARSAAQLAARPEDGALSARPLPPIAAGARGEAPPLAFPQEQVWFLSRLAPESLAYNFQFSIHLAGPFEPERWRRAIEEVVRRHEILRTTFPEVEGTPVQRVHEPWPVALPVADLSALPAARRRAAADAAAATLVRRPFALDRLPLFRGHLLRLAADEHLFVQVEHHFVHDGWSLAIYVRELIAGYEAAGLGRPPALPPLPVQYADFAAWQRRDLAPAAFPAQLDSWRRRLARLPPPLVFETDRPRPRHQGFRGDRLRVELPAGLAAAARDFSRHRRVTLFTSTLAAFAALGQRYTGLSEFLVGSGLANRRLREIEGIIGMVVNTIVLPADLAAAPTGAELLAQAGREALAAQDRQDLPLELLVADLQPERDLSRNPLFAVLFSFHDSPVPDLRFAGLTGTLTELHNRSAKADLNVVVRPRGEQRVGRRAAAEDEDVTFFWEFDRDLFDRATVERMWAHYQALLGGILADPSLRIAELPLLSAAERTQVVERWSGAEGEHWPEPPPGPWTPLAARVAARAAAAPRGPAVVEADGGTVGYGELVARAAALAGRLRAAGLGAEGRVAILLERSADLVAAQLATLAAGGVFVPLDPAQPAERLAGMIADARPAVVVTRAGLAARLLAGRLPSPAAGGPEVLRLDPEDAAGGAGTGAALEVEPVDPARLAYIIFTSGSTGRPKGVAVTHGGLSALVDWHLAVHRFGPADRASLVAGLGFDATVWEIWPALAAGAALHLPDEEVRTDPERLAAWLAASRVTVGFLPTPVAELALAARWPPGTRLRVLTVGGDRLHRHPPEGLPFELVNVYGPTETTVVSTAGTVPPGRRRRLPDIGRPITGWRAFVLDREGAAVPPGVPGELWLGGVGVARGYFGRPAQTAERFRPDPFAAEPGGRLYGTGDRVRWRDGRLEFLGRADRQVKVRGVRIEPAEIEAVLATHPAVAAAAVVPIADPAGEIALAAYWAPADSAAVTERVSEADLLRWLADRLPGPMVPAWIVRLEALPLDPSGKVDRAALPAPDRAARPERAFAAPEDEVEELVAAVWSEVLGRDRVGRDDHFFELGGHSLSATRVVGRLRAALAEEVPLTLVFDRPVLSDFAAALEESLAAGGGG